MAGTGFGRDRLRRHAHLKEGHRLGEPFEAQTAPDSNSMSFPAQENIVDGTRNGDATGRGNSA